VQYPCFENEVERRSRHSASTKIIGGSMKVSDVMAPDVEVVTPTIR
jgi:hypothetical protein